jgi:methionyl aminopeptidase
MIRLKTDEEIAALREGGKILSDILTELVDKVGPGVMTGDLDAYAEARMRAAGGEPSFKGYRSGGEAHPFPSTVCTSINHEVVHAPATPSRELKNGDLFKMDIGLRYKGLCTDMAVTVPIGDIDEELRTLLEVTKQSLLLGVKKCVEGGLISDIGKAVDKSVRRAGYTTVKDLVGHGVGHHVHEDPQIPNYFDPRLDPIRIQRGMVLAIEPMVNFGAEDVRVLDDEWTIVTADKTYSAHFEVTVAITENGTEIITPIPENA